VKPRRLGALAVRAQVMGSEYLRDATGANAVRYVLALGLLIGWWAAADAATLHRSKPSRMHLPTHQSVTAPGRPPDRFAPPGWTDGQTQRWLDNASAGSGLG
jgi:hypothetical protein